MADVVTADGKVYRNGVLQARPTATPGVGGAISDVVAALARAFAPKGITQRGNTVSQAIDSASGAPTSLGSQF